MSSEPPAPKSSRNGELVPERHAGLSLSEKLKKAQAEANRWRELAFRPGLSLASATLARNQAVSRQAAATLYQKAVDGEQSQRNQEPPAGSLGKSAVPEVSLPRTNWEGDGNEDVLLDGMLRALKGQLPRLPTRRIAPPKETATPGSDDGPDPLERAYAEEHRKYLLENAPHLLKELEKSGDLESYLSSLGESAAQREHHLINPNDKNVQNLPFLERVRELQNRQQEAREIIKHDLIYWPPPQPYED